MLRGDRPEGVVPGRAVERAAAVGEHPLDEVLSAPEEEVGHALVLLGGGAEGALDVVVLVLQDLLELVEDDDDAPPPLLGHLRRCGEHLVEGRRGLLPCPCAELEGGVAGVVERERGLKPAEELLATLRGASRSRVAAAVASAFAVASTNASVPSVGQRST